MQLATPELNIAANRQAQKWLVEIKAELDALSPAVQTGCWKVILDRCTLKRSGKTTLLTREQMIQNVEERLRALHEKYASRWKWPNYFVDFSRDCGIDIEPPKDDAAQRFATALQEAIDYDRHNSPQLLKLKEKIVDAILTFHGHRRATLIGSEALEGARLADEWIAKMEAEIVDVELKGRERFWEKIALSARQSLA